MPDTHRDVDLQPSLFESLWRHKWLILAATVTAAVVGFAISSLQPLVYQAEGNVLLTSPGGTAAIADPFTSFIDRGRYVRNEAEVFKSYSVSLRASEILGGDPSADEIQSVVSAHGEFEFDVLTIGATQPTGQGAIDVVNAVVQAYDEVVTEQIQTIAGEAVATLEESKVQLEVRLAETNAGLAESPDDEALLSQRRAQLEQLQELDEQIEAIVVSTSLYGAGIRIYDAPRGAFLIGPRPLRNAAIAAVLALIAAGAWAWWREENNDEVADRNAPALVLNAPLLGAIPLFEDVGIKSDIPTVSDPGSVASEAYHIVVSALRLTFEHIAGTTVMITSVGPGDGKTVTALNVGIAAAGSGTVPLLIDADQRTRELSRHADLAATRGLTDLSANGEVTNVVHDVSFGSDLALQLVPAGIAAPGEAVRYFRSPAFNRVMPTLTADRGLVIVDAPPILAVAETMDIARQVDGIVMVVRPGASMRQLSDAADRIAMTDRPILGYVYNGAETDSTYTAYGYNYGPSAAD